MRALIKPGFAHRFGVGGVGTVIEKWYKHLPELGVSVVEPGSPYDVELVHAGIAPFTAPRGANVAVLHGMYWTAEMEMGSIYHQTNYRIIESIRNARAVTVPAEWVAKTIRREMHIDPFIVPHGVDADEWTEGIGRNEGYILWAKNTDEHVCTPAHVQELAARLPEYQFISTFGVPTDNMRVNGAPFDRETMKRAVLGCAIWLHTTPETFGIATLEAMAAGKPVVGFDSGYTGYIKHGENGFLAKVGDYDALVYGIKWAHQNYEALSRNARLTAEQWTWRAACEKLIEAMEHAERAVHERGVTFVIPARNKAGTLAGAIESALSQDTTEHVQVIIVDDASTDNTGEVAESYAKRDNVRYIRNDNRWGVAHARNLGIEAAQGDFIVTLDADDQVDNSFVSTLLKPLRHDPTLGVAYTGLGVIAPNGIVKSKWPEGFDFKKQMAGRNCVPTCAMFRKSAWGRAGGYRARYNRYHLLGHGSEDAAFWLGIAALGYNIKQVTPEPLFHYRQGGGTSSNYTELKWNDMYGDGDLPTMAPRDWKVDAPPPIKIYEPSRVAIIIPVGPGHEVIAADAIDSALSQLYYKTDVIVVWDSPMQIPEWYKSGYPAVRFVRRPVLQKPLGAGAARNLGARSASKTVRFLVFLDADDKLRNDYISTTISAWNRTQKIVYTDYIGTQVLAEGVSPDDVVGKIDFDGPSRMVYTRAVLNDFDRERAVQQPTDPPFVWCPVTSLIPKKWFDEIGGFDESLETWEDWDLHIRLAKAGHEYEHINEPLLSYRLWAGKRREFGRENFSALALFDRVGRGEK